MDKKLRDITEVKETLVSWMKNETAKGCAEADGKELGEVADMIKDLAEAECYCMKACYYKKITEAMDEYEEGEEDDRMGYNHRRYSSGRYAPSGRGHVSGYISQPVMHHEMMDGMIDEHPEYMRMGYTGGGRNGSSSGRSGSESGSQSNMGYSGNERWGRAYRDFQESKRHYTATGSLSDKNEMETHMNEHMADTMASIREMWKTAEPATKKKLKADMTALMNEMTV